MRRVTGERLKIDAKVAWDPDFEPDASTVRSRQGF
jgi:hypothetical protein